MKEQEMGLPEGWELTTLADLTTMIRGVSYKKEQSSTEYIEGYLPVLRANNIQNNQIILDDLVYVQADLIKEEQKLKMGDIVVAMSSGSKSVVGKTARVEEDKDAGFGAFCGLLRPKNSIEPRLISQFTQSSYYRNTISALSAGANINNLKPSHFKEIKFPLPPLPEQQHLSQKLTALLDGVAEAKQRLEKIPALLKQFRQSVLADAVSGKLTEEWRKENEAFLTVDDIKTRLSSFKSKTKELEPISQNNEWVNCQLGHLLTVKSGDGLTAKEMVAGDIPVYGGNGISGFHNQSNVEQTTIVIGRVGFYCGSIHLTAEKSWVTDNALMVTLCSEVITKEFAYYLLKSLHLGRLSSSTAQPVISGSKIYSVKINLPSLNEQTQIIPKVETYFALADKIETEAANALEKVNLLTQSILAKAFRGELSADWRAENKM